MQRLWFIGPVWYKGKVVRPPRRMPTPFRKPPERVPHRITGEILSTATWLKYRTRY